MTDAAADLEIVPFDPDRDDAELFALFARIVEAGEGYPHDAPLSRADYDGLWRSPVATVTVARLGGRLVGAYYLKPNYAGKASHIANAGYVVDASARGLGLGRRLVQHSIEAAPGLGFDAIVFNLVFESNPARPMYEEFGWQQVGRIPDAVDGEAGIVYWRAV
jgi:GNAT superfamily N-acetyltransferase